MVAVVVAATGGGLLLLLLLLLLVELAVLGTAKELQHSRGSRSIY